MGNEQQHFKIVGVTAHIITEEHHKGDSFKQTCQIFDELDGDVEKAVDVSAIGDYTRKRYDGTADIVFRNDDAGALAKLLQIGLDNNLIDKAVGNRLYQVAMQMPNYAKQVILKANYDKNEDMRSLTLSLPYPKSKPIEMKIAGGLVPDDIMKQIEEMPKDGYRDTAAVVKAVDGLYRAFNSHKQRDNLFGYRFDLQRREEQAESKGERSTEWFGIGNHLPSKAIDNPLYKGIDRYATIGRDNEMTFFYPADTAHQDLVLGKLFGNKVEADFMTLTLNSDGKVQKVGCTTKNGIPFDATLDEIKKAYPLISADRIIEQAISNSLQFEYGYYIGENKELGIMESKCDARIAVVEDGKGGYKTKDLKSYIDEIHKRMLLFAVSQAYDYYIDNMGGSPKVKEAANEASLEEKDDDGGHYPYFGVGSFERTKEQQEKGEDVSLGFYGIEGDTIWLFSEHKSLGDVLRKLDTDKILNYLKTVSEAAPILGNKEDCRITNFGVASMLSFMANEKLMQEMDKIHINDELMNNIPSIYYNEYKTAFEYALEMHGEKPLDYQGIWAIFDAGKISTMEKPEPPVPAPAPMLEKKTFSLPSVKNPKGGTVSKASKKPAGKKEAASPSPVSDAPEKPDADAKDNVSEDITDTL